MRISVLTIFPELFGTFLETSLVGRAVEAGSLSVDVHDLRDFSEDRHHTSQADHVDNDQAIRTARRIEMVTKQQQPIDR